jgi:hypothetical protein
MIPKDPTHARNSLRVDREGFCGLMRSVAGAFKPRSVQRFALRFDGAKLRLSCCPLSLVMDAEGAWTARITVGAVELMKAAEKVAQIPRITVEIDGAVLMVGGVPVRYSKR